ncbi:hypothetical protein R1sor_021046 [Riccia sorocarpa]|uniref:CRM domain-containing protein n=1 Tax=Riccia sorocarpa TaxID=122646 RepID=A0ABD3GFY4_9MARC
MKGFGTGALIHGLLKNSFRASSVGRRFQEGCTCSSRWFHNPQLAETSSKAVRWNDGISPVADGGSEPNSGLDSKDSYYGKKVIHQPEGRLYESFQIPYNHQQRRNYGLLPLVERGRWMRLQGAYPGPLSSSSARDPFRYGSVRFKSRKKQKKAKQKKREVLAKIKRIRVASKKRKEDMTPEELLEFRILRGKRKIELLDQQIAKFPVQELPPLDPDIEVLTPEQLHYLKKIGYKNKNYVPVGRRGVYGGTIQNIHLHWKKHETVQVEIVGFSKDEIKVMAEQLARLSGGLVVDIHQGNIVILYRGRNYKQPKELIPLKTLDKRKALMKSKLEQSRKALVVNQEKLEKELKQLRKDIAQGLVAGAQPSDAGKDEAPVHRNLGPADKEELQDPDSYGSRTKNQVDDEDDDCLSDLEGFSDMSDDTSDTEEDSLQEDDDGDSEDDSDSEEGSLDEEDDEDSEEDSDSEEIEEIKRRVKIKYRR